MNVKSFKLHAKIRGTSHTDRKVNGNNDKPTANTI